MRFYVANSYYEAWKFIPILLLTAVFSNVSAFLGTTYLVKKKTKGLFSTTIWGMIINVILSILLIPLFGLYGASFSGAIGFLFVSILRLKQTSEWITIKIEWKLQVLLIFGYLLISSIEYLTNELFIIKIIILSSMFLFILFT
ncbi:polysaccharide biosynthesis C-terminal domain-containing protein [Lactococcus lactis]